MSDRIGIYLVIVYGTLPAILVAMQVTAWAKGRRRREAIE